MVRATVGSRIGRFIEAGAIIRLEISKSMLVLKRSPESVGSKKDPRWAGGTRPLKGTLLPASMNKLAKRLGRAVEGWGNLLDGFGSAGLFKGELLGSLGYCCTSFRVCYS